MDIENIIKQMTQEERVHYMEQQYSLLKAYKHKQNCQILFNLIHAKVQFGMPNYKYSLYLDAKKFVNAYINAAEAQDYGYDEVLLDKIKEVVKPLEQKQRVSVLHTARRLMYMRGYEVDDVVDEIRNQKIKVARKGNLKQKLYALCLWMSARWWALLLSYLAYIVILCFVLLPAPYKWMELFVLEYKPYDDSFLWNHILNTLALLTGNDNLSPVITPTGIVGMIVYVIGIVLFYLMIGNFVLRQLEDYLTLK